MSRGKELEKAVARAARVTHGAAVRGCMTPEYAAWQRAIGRCENKARDTYQYYGGRGIRVCSRWRHSFAAFLADMGPRPSSKHSLDRIDVDGNYEPGNCRWATHAEQVRNRRNAVSITFNGETKSLIEWANDLGISYGTLWFRIRNWPIERALTEPKRAW